MSDIPLAGAPPSSSPSGDTIGRLEEEANRRARQFESEAAGSFSDQARETREAAARQSAEIAGRFKERALDFAEDKKRSGSARLERLAGAARRAADDLERDSPDTARYVRSAAQGVEDFSASLRDCRIEDLAAEARDFARRRPWLVFGTAVLAGLAVTRFLKSSREDEDESRAYGSDRFGGRHDRG